MLLSDVTSEFVYNAYHLNNDMDFHAETVDAKSLLSYKRLDIVAKALYLKLKDLCPSHAKKIYLEHIRVMTKNSFIEAGSKKNGKDAFIKSFNDLYDDMEKFGYRANFLPIPVDQNNCIMDGAHRVACAIALNIPVKIVRLPVDAIYDLYDYNYFLENDLDKNVLDEIVLSYINANKEKNIGCINIWPSAIGHRDELENLILSNCDVVYKKNINFNENGAFQYLAQIYKEYSWAQDDGDGFSGVYRKLLPCFPSFSAVTVYFVEIGSYNGLTALKEDIRKIYNIEKHSCHATDNLAETIEMANILLSNNTIDFLNNCNTLKFKSTFELLKEIQKFDINKNVFTGSIVLALYGIREANDIDFLTLESDKNDSHNDLIKYYPYDLNDFFYNHNCYFVYFGIKFITLKNLKEFKKNRNESKDKDDIKLIDMVLENKSKSNFTIVLLQYKRRFIAKVQGQILKFAHKTGTYDILRNVYKKLKK